MVYYKLIHLPRITKEVKVTDEEEKEIEKECLLYNIKLIKECLKISESIINEEKLNYRNKLRIALALYEKQSSHVVYWKDKYCRMKLEKTLN